MHHLHRNIIQLASICHIIFRPGFQKPAHLQSVPVPSDIAGKQSRQFGICDCNTVLHPHADVALWSINIAILKVMRTC